MKVKVACMLYNYKDKKSKKTLYTGKNMHWIAKRLKIYYEIKYKRNVLTLTKNVNSETLCNNKKFLGMGLKAKFIYMICIGLHLKWHRKLKWKEFIKQIQSEK